MRVDETRFAELVGPHCPGERCAEPVLFCTVNLRDGRILIEANPHSDGIYRLTDTGLSMPFAQTRAVQARFGRQGTLHRRHDTSCDEAARARARKKRR